MSCCGGNCSCRSGCKSGNGCNGCGMYLDLGSSEQTLTFKIIITSVAPVNMHLEESKTSFGTENGGCGCGCGGSCKCRSTARAAPANDKRKRQP